jgi:hypothetical protein
MRRKTSDEINAALRADPDYQDLCRLLDKQTAPQKARLEKRLTREEESEPMETREDIDNRILDLKEKQGLSYAKVAERLNEAGYTTATGGLFKKSSVQTRYEIIRKQRENGERSEPPGEPCESSPVAIPPEWLEPLRQLIRKEINQASPACNDIAIDSPPSTPRKKGSKEYQGERETLPGCRIDKVLFDRFEAERERTHVSASGLMQKILWNYFQRPPLSFEIFEESDQ